MNENVENIVLEQLRLIRADIRKLDENLSGRIDALDGKLSGRIDDLDGKVDGNTGILVALGRYLRDIDTRVEHIEEKLGIE
jgi:hypothetical protein